MKVTWRNFNASWCWFVIKHTRIYFIMFLSSDETYLLLMSWSSDHLRHGRNFFSGRNILGAENRMQQWQTATYKAICDGGTTLENFGTTKLWNTSANETASHTRLTFQVMTSQVLIFFFLYLSHPDFSVQSTKNPVFQNTVSIFS